MTTQNSKQTTAQSEQEFANQFSR